MDARSNGVFLGSRCADQPFSSSTIRRRTLSLRREASRFASSKNPVVPRRWAKGIDADTATTGHHVYASFRCVPQDSWHLSVGVKRVFWDRAILYHLKASSAPSVFVTREFLLDAKTHHESVALFTPVENIMSRWKDSGAVLAPYSITSFKP